jgi:hypothetical protein
VPFFVPVLRSLHRNIGELHHFGPFLCFVDDESAEFSRRHRHWDAAKIDKLRTHLRIGMRGGDRLVQDLDVSGGVPFGAEIPYHTLVS